MTGKPVRILVIAGSDSSGGAGVQADIKTATALGAYAMTAITAVTVQDTRGLYGIHPVPADIVRDQILRTLDDIGADVVKIGMLGGAETVRIVGETLRTHAQRIPVVLDPVMAATAGGALLADDALEALKDELFPLAALLTPNAPEASRLLGWNVKNTAGLAKAARALLAFGPGAVLVKGGHIEGEESIDVLATIRDDDVKTYRSPRLRSRHTHGTGCTLASAIAVGLGEGLALGDAVARARSFVLDAIRTAPGFGLGHGPLNHMHKIEKA